MRVCLRGHIKKPGRSSCRICQTMHQRKYRKSAKGRATHRRWRDTPKGKANTSAERRRFHIRHSDKRSAAHRAWYAANREHALAVDRAYRARLKAAYGSMTRAFWAEQERNAA